MNKFFGISKTKFLIVTFLLLLIHNTPIYASEEFDSTLTPTQVEYTVEANKLDKRAKILSDYLALHNSPLQYHAQDFIDAADANQMDWRLVAAIAGVESTFGKFVPGASNTPYNSYNAWGWGASSPDKAIYFKSWREGIFTVSEGLKKNYIDKGYTEPLAMNKIYAASPHWGWKVTFFLGEIDKFSKDHASNKVAENPAKVSQLNKTAAASGIIEEGLKKNYIE